MDATENANTVVYRSVWVLVSSSTRRPRHKARLCPLESRPVPQTDIYFIPWDIKAHFVVSFVTPSHGTANVSIGSDCRLQYNALPRWATVSSEACIRYTVLKSLSTALSLGGRRLDSTALAFTTTIMETSATVCIYRLSFRAGGTKPFPSAARVSSLTRALQMQWKNDSKLFQQTWSCVLHPEKYI